MINGTGRADRGGGSDVRRAVVHQRECGTHVRVADRLVDAHAEPTG